MATGPVGGGLERVDITCSFSRKSSISQSGSRGGSFRLMHVDVPAAVESVFSRTNATSADDEEALRWAALERLDTFERLRTTMVRKVTGSLDHIDVKKISPQERQHLVSKVLQLTDDDQEPFLMKLRKRIDR